ncbi:MAG: DNA-binding response regulator [Anaerolineaceae bacterium]|nr:DNA-binding response regulator [Anaerolineaceae bacterium]MCA9881415.1 response regulator transcription factor [Anaerolineae bacterium]MCA9886736.1 response regulator transcription factor [Anaerolineae bacterium]MCA9891361.1 response regulator transcription factor [Anaerolineae bacterium]
MATILVIDDEESILNVVEAYLKADGNIVHLARDGASGLAAFRRYNPDLVILDIMLPEMDGMEVLQNIRRESDVYVMMLTAKSEEFDRVMGLTVGADDYLTKPFSPRELAARVKAILRRGRNAAADERQILAFEHLTIDVSRHEVERDGELIDLTALEFKLLATLATYAGMVLSREQLLERVWGYDFYGEDRVVDVHIGHIRQKLEIDPVDPQFIVTVRGVGYKFADEPR